MHTTFLSHEDAAVRNRNMVLKYIKRYGPVSRTDIWEKMNISRASVTQIIRQLQDRGLVLEIGERESTGGRKPTLVEFNGSAKKIYAFDWSSKVLALIDMNTAILYEKKMEFAARVSPMAFAADILAEIAIIDKLGLCDQDEIVGIGLGLPGIIEPRTDTVIYSTDLGWQNVNMKALFANRFGSNVFLERIGNLMLIGENAHRKDKSARHSQLFILSSGGIGAAAIVRDECQHGTNSMYGELGHIKIPSDVICSCGQRGCLEAVIADLLMKSNGEFSDSVLEHLAIGISTALNISDAGVAILVGSYVEDMTQEQRDKLRDLIIRKLTIYNMRTLEIVFSIDVKKLALDGIGTYVFDRYYPVD